MRVFKEGLKRGEELNSLRDLEGLAHSETTHECGGAECLNRYGRMMH